MENNERIIKAFNLIKEKNINPKDIKLTENVKIYNYYHKYSKLTQEEYELLKEVLL